jgi:hypothetical protein
LYPTQPRNLHPTQPRREKFSRVKFSSLRGRVWRKKFASLRVCIWREKFASLRGRVWRENFSQVHFQQKNIADRIRTQLSKVPKPIDFSNNVRLSTENSNEHFVSETENSDADDLRSLQSILNGEDLDETQTICDDFPSMQSSFMDGISNQEDVCVKLQHTREMLSETEEINVKLMEQVN